MASTPESAPFAFATPSVDFIQEDGESSLRQDHPDSHEDHFHNIHAPAESPVYRRIRHLKFVMLVLLSIFVVFNVVMIVADGLQLTQWYSNGQVAKNPQAYKSAFVLFAIHICSCVLFVGISALGFSSITPFRNRTQFILGVIFMVCLLLMFATQVVLIIAMVSTGPDFLQAGYGASFIPLFILCIGLASLSGFRNYFVYQVIY
jgi:hypothetical protein